MSQQTVEIVRGLFESWNKRRIADTVVLFHNDIELDARQLPMPDINRVYSGLVELGQWAVAWLSAWEHLQAEPIWIKERHRHRGRAPRKNRPAVDSAPPSYDSFIGTAGGVGQDGNGHHEHQG